MFVALEALIALKLGAIKSWLYCMKSSGEGVRWFARCPLFFAGILAAGREAPVEMAKAPSWRVGGGFALDVLMPLEEQTRNRGRRRAIFGRAANRSMVPGYVQGGTRVVPGWQGGANRHSQYCECLCKPATSRPYATLWPSRWWGELVGDWREDSGHGCPQPTPLAFDGFIPKGWVRIAQRFNAGTVAKGRQVQKGWLTTAASAVPSGLIPVVAHTQR